MRYINLLLVALGVSLALPLAGRAQIAIQDGPSPIEYNGASNLNAATFTVSPGASALVVFLGTRTQGDSPGTDPGLPATLTWNGNVLVQAVALGSTASTWDDNAIYYLLNPPAGSGSISGALNSTISQNWWMAYTLNSVNTNAPILNGSVSVTLSSGPDVINNTVANVAAGAWAAVVGSASIGSHSTLGLTTSPSGGSVLPNVDTTQGNADEFFGSVSNCPAGSDEFILTSGQNSSPKMVLAEAIFTPFVAPPAAPTLSLTTPGPFAQAKLFWVEPTNSFVSSYLLVRSTNSTGPFTDYTNVLSSGITSFTDSNVLSGRTYYYVVGAANAAGTNFSTTRSGTPSGSPFPPALGVGAWGAQQIALHWTPSYGATNYIVSSSTNSGGETQLATVGGNTYTNSGLTAGTTYYYTVKAVGAGGTSGPSDEASAVALGTAWYLVDNFSLDNAGAPLNGQTGSAGQGQGWTNLGGGTPIAVTNGSTFGGVNFAQYAAGSPTSIGDYEAGLGIAGTSSVATVFLEFSLPGIQYSTVNQTGPNVVAMNFDIDSASPPGAVSGTSVTGPSAQLNYDNSSGNGYFRVNSGGTFYYLTISSNSPPYLAIPGNLYYLWVVVNAANGTYQIYLGDGSETGNNVDAGGLSAAPTLLWGTTNDTLNGTLATYTFRNVSAGAPVGQPVNYVATGPGSQLGTVAQTEFGNIYVDAGSLDLVNPATGLGPTGAQVLVQPQNLQLYAGENATFSVVASLGVTAYQWQTNAPGNPPVNINNGPGVSGATSSTLIISNVSAANALNYSCLVSNLNGNASGESLQASLTIVSPSGAYESAAAAVNPVHYYAFNDQNNPAGGAASAYDFAGSDNGVYGANAQNGFDHASGPATANGFPGFVSPNYAVQLAGNDEPNGVSISSPWDIDTNAVTITAWINPSTSTEPNSTAIVLNRGSGTDVDGLIFNTTGAFTLGYEWNDDNNTTGWDSGLRPPANQWSFVALVVTPTNATINLMTTNEMLSSTHVYAHPVAPFAGTTMIGDDPGAPGGALTFNGLIDEVGIFNQALSQALLQTLFLDASGKTASAFPVTNSVTLDTPAPIYPGTIVQFSAVVGGAAPLVNAWQIDGANLSDGPSVYGTIIGSATANLIISNLAPSTAGHVYTVTLVTQGNTTYTTSPGVTLSVATPSALPLQLEIPFTDAGPGTSAAASVSTLGPLSLSLLSSNGVATDYHGVPGSGVSGLNVGLDFSTNSDFSFNGGDYFGLGPIAKTAASTALNYGAVKSFTATIWFKPHDYVLYQQGTSGPRVFILGANGVLELGAPNSIGLYFQQGNEVSFNFNGTELDPIALEGGPNYLLDQWYFYAITYNGTTVTAYQGTDGGDGTVGVSEILSGSLPGQTLNLGTPTSAGSTLQIGNRAQDQGYSFDGWFNDFRFYAATNGAGTASAVQIEDIRWSVLAPASLAMTIHGNTNIVTWNNLPGASGYLVYRSTNSAGPYSQISTGAVPNPIYMDNPAPPGTWYYEVAAVDGGGDFTTSALSQPVQNVQTSSGTVLANLPAANITAISATLNGKVLSVVGSTPAATFYYGPSDGGTNASNWAGSVSAGPVSGSFSATVQGLGSNTTYFYTVMATNDVGLVWAAPSASFVTEVSTLPQITNTPATAVAATYATLNGQVLSAGGSPASVTFYYGTTDGQTNAANWSYSALIGPQTGVYAQTVNNLSSNTTYYFTAKAVNADGTQWATPSLSFTTAATNTVSSLISVLTHKYDNFRSGANTNEHILTLANVNVTNFSKLFSYAVDGYCYASPLYVANLQIPGQGTHNTVFAFTENDSIYAFDADSNQGPNGGLLWHTNLGISLISTYYATRYHHNVLNPIIGITGTPVIDPVSGTLYLDVFSGVVSNTPNGFHTIHALDITTGAERPYSPVLVSASVPGTGVNSSNGVVTFNPEYQMNRPALTLSGGMLYVCYGSYGDTDPYHGWVMGYNATNLHLLTNYLFATTPNASMAAFGVNAGEGALWMGGDGPCVDAGGNLYFMSGNGSFSAQTNGGDYGDSFVRLSTTNGFAVADYFSPSNTASLAINDEDLGSGGPVMLSTAAGSAAHPHLLVGAGKEGNIFVLDCDNMGHFNPGANQIVQELISAVGGLWSSPSYFNNHVFFQGSGDVLKSFGISNAVMTTSPVTQSGVSFGGGYSTPSISANGTSDAIVWDLQTDGSTILHAFNATNLSQELYNSNLNPSRDQAGGSVNYAVPVVANGKVYVRGQYFLDVYGVGIFLPPPLISPNGGTFTNSVTVSLSDATNDATIYYTLDGTTPTVHSPVYTGPFTLSNSAAVKAIATLAGAFNSPVESASFIDTSEIGSGTGLLGQYWSNTTSVAFTNVSFNTPPTLVRTDAVINFNWGSGGPAPTVGASNYVVRWTGTIQPQFSGAYTFSTTADDGVRLYVNGQLLINDWVTQAATTASNSISLVAQQLYNIELDYFYQNDNGSQVALSWSSASVPQSPIPQTQLYPYANPPPTIVLTSPANGSSYTASASVSIGAMADAPYNPINSVAFYANGNWLGSLNSSPTAPLYTLTSTGFNQNLGGTSAISAEVSATPLGDANLTTTTAQAAGADWTAAIWKTNGTGTAVSPVAGNNYALVSDGTAIGNGLNNTRLRSPATPGDYTFPGDSLTLNLNTELRMKNEPGTLTFAGVGANPGLILNGGMLNGGTDGATTIAGTVRVNGQSYDSMQGANGGGGGLAPNPRPLTISATLSGSGNIVIMNCATNAPEVISGVSNTFSGQWIVQAGWLQGATPGSLGTNSITVNPLYIGYLLTMPGANSPVGPAALEVNYDLNSSGTLTLVNGGLMYLHQNCTFAAVNIESTSLPAGTYSYGQLIARFPNNFLPGGSGSITVSLPAVSGPGPVPPPTGVTAVAANAQISLSWNACVGATNYNVMRATTSGGPYTTVATLPGTSYTDTGLANGTTYYYVVTAVSPPGYVLTAVATDASGLSATAAPVFISVNPGSGLPYGLTSNVVIGPFLNSNMPGVIPAILPGNLPTLLSQSGAFLNTPARTPMSGLISYASNTPLWSDGAAKSRYMAVPNNGGLITPAEQIAFLPTNSWTFPAGTVFVKNFDLAVNTTNPAVPLRRLETRLLVRDANGAVYGVTYKWRADNSDADLLTTSLNENILVTNASGVTTQTWYYPSPADCLTCHTPVANYVLGVNTRQLNGALTYPGGVTDNQLRTLNHLGLFYPAIDEGGITNYAQLSSITNSSASFEQRARSYLDANCAQCHQPGGTGITFDARYDTPLDLQYIVNVPAQFSLGYDHACVVKADDVWRSMIWQRMNTVNRSIQMPPLARNLIDSNAVAVMAAWINSLPGTPALPPPLITPNGGVFNQTVAVTIQASDTNATVHYTLDGTLPTTNSPVYSVPLLISNTLTLSANEFEANFNNSVAASALFLFQPLSFASAGFGLNQVFQAQLSGAIAGNTYVLQASTNFVNWTPLNTNFAASNIVNLVDPGASNYPFRFYRVHRQ